MLGHGHSDNVERIQALIVRAQSSNLLTTSGSLMMTCSSRKFIFYAVLEDSLCFNEMGMHLGTSDHSAP